MTYELIFFLASHSQKHKEKFLPFPSSLTLLYFVFQNLAALLILISSILICAYESFVFLLVRMDLLQEMHW